MKISVIRLAFAMSRELRKHNVVAVALTPGFLRSERVLEHFGVSESNWKDLAKKKRNHDRNSKRQNDAISDFMVSETPRYVGRAVVALAADPKVKNKTGRVFSSWAPGPRIRLHRSRRHPATLGRLRPKEIRQLQNLR